MNGLLNKVFIYSGIFMLCLGCKENFTIKESRFEIQVPGINKSNASRIETESNSVNYYYIGDSTYMLIDTYGSGCLEELGDYNLNLNLKLDECGRNENAIYFILSTDYSDGVYVENRIKVIKGNSSGGGQIVFRYEFWKKVCNSNRTIYVRIHKYYNKFDLQQIFVMADRYIIVSVDIID